MIVLVLMPEAHLRNIDLNLLVALEALLRERHVTRAAASLAMSQSGMSRALKRLRELFDDPLLVEGRQGLDATPRAEALAASVGRALAEVRQMMRASPFDPAEASGAIRLGVPDHLAWLLTPPLMAAVASRAPRVELVLRSFSRDWRQDLADGAVDLAFGVLSGDETGLRRKALHDDPWVVLLRGGHPACRRRWDLDAFTRYGHGLMTVTGDGPGQVDRALAARGLERRIAFRASSPLVVAMATAESDLLVTTTRSLALRLSPLLNLVIKPVPLEVKALALPLVWHERLHHDARHRWLRDLVSGVVGESFR